MQTQHVVRTLLVVGLVWGCGSSGSARRFAPIAYPAAARTDGVERIHGVEVADPYRWLEDENSAETRAWIEAQNRVTDAFLAACPARDEIRARLTELWDFERCSVPVQRGGRYFFRKNDGLQNQDVLHVADALEAAPRVLIDPNVLAEDGTVALAGTAASEDGNWLAYALAAAGSDWMEWRIRNVATGEDLPDLVKWSKFSRASWTHDGRGFFYSRYDPPLPGARPSSALVFQKLYFHQRGTPQAEDVLVYQDPDHEDYGFDGFVTEDGQYLGIHVWQGTLEENLFYLKRLDDPRAPLVKLIDTFEATYRYLGNDGSVFWFLTSLEAPLQRVIAIDVERPERAGWKEVIPAGKHVLESVSVVGERLVACYLEDAHAAVKLFRLDGTFERALELPGIGTVGGFTGRRTDTETFFAFTSFARPQTIYRHDFALGYSLPFHRPTLGFEPQDYVTRQVRCTSKDGTAVPLFLTHKQDLVPDAETPTLLYGYGGFNVSLTPSFRVGNLVWMERGGIYAQACLRGGGEYGRQWHLAGTRLRKQNVFDDFNAAAEWLVANGHTSPARLAINGHSNGGLLVGACMVQRPELFGACVPQVGVLDMLRFHKFTIGHAWVSDYGSPAVREEFLALRAYSPLHNLRPGVSYPPTLITTADHDDRVVPAHSFKFAAQLQACQAGDGPVLIRIETRAGHGGGKPTTKQIEEDADVLAFLARVLAPR
ncbi:MAG: S9 family peptidase [Planctomycetes bacterium]|nr:S9 family peptidase [Planctomycetota bacterium]